MTSRTRVDLEDFYGAIDVDDVDRAVGLLSDDVDWIWGGVPQSGRAAVRRFLGRGGESLANRKHRITAFTEGGGNAAAELSVTAVHSGPLYLPTGPIPASGVDLTISVCHFLHIGGDGLFDVSHIYVDFVGLLAQIPRG